MQKYRCFKHQQPSLSWYQRKGDHYYRSVPSGKGTTTTDLLFLLQTLASKILRTLIHTLINKTIGIVLYLYYWQRRDHHLSTMTLPTQKPSSRYPFKRFGCRLFSHQVCFFFPLRCVLYSLTLNGTPLSSKSPIYFQMHAYLYYPQHLVVRNSSTSTTWCSMKHHFLLLNILLLLTSQVLALE